MQFPQVGNNESSPINVTIVGDILATNIMVNVVVNGGLFIRSKEFTAIANILPLVTVKSSFVP